MKTNLNLMMAGLFLFSPVAMGQNVQSLTVSTTLPDASGMQLTVIPVNASTNVAGTGSTTATTIPFGTLTFNATDNIYLPQNYYDIIIGGIGAGIPTVDVTYTEGSNPNNPGSSINGLGTKTTATFVTVGTNHVETISSLGKQRLIDLTGNAGYLSSIPQGSYEKVYVGIWTGSTAAPADPSNGKPFSNTDVAGTYNGTLTFTVVSL